MPIHLIEILRTLNRRIDHSFTDPDGKTTIDESNRRKRAKVLKICYLFFANNVSFVPVKTRKRGRIKRKLRRRLTIKNSVTD